MGSSTLLKAEIDADTPMAHYWSEAKLAGLDVALLAPLSIASVQVRKGKASELVRTIDSLQQIRLTDGPKSSGNKKLEFLGTGPGAWLAVWSTHSLQNVDRLRLETRHLASVADQSSAYRIFRVSGVQSKAFLARGLSMNLNESGFETGSVVVSSIAHIGVVVWQTNDKKTVMIAVASSYCESFCHWIRETLDGLVQEARITQTNQTKSGRTDG